MPGEVRLIMEARLNSCLRCRATIQQQASGAVHPPPRDIAVRGDAVRLGKCAHQMARVRTQ